MMTTTITMMAALIEVVINYFLWTAYFLLCFCFTCFTNSFTENCICLQASVIPVSGKEIPLKVKPVYILNIITATDKILQNWETIKTEQTTHTEYKDEKNIFLCAWWRVSSSTSPNLKWISQSLKPITIYTGQYERSHPFHEAVNISSKFNP